MSDSSRTTRPLYPGPPIRYDSITCDLGALKSLIAVVGRNGCTRPGGAVATSAQLPPEQVKAVRSANAQRLFTL